MSVVASFTLHYSFTGMNSFYTLTILLTKCSYKSVELLSVRESPKINRKYRERLNARSE